MNRTALRAGSLRGRITRTTILLVAGALIAVLVVLDVLFGILAREQIENRLADRAAFAVQLDERNVKPQPMVNRLSGAGISAQVVTADGTRQGRDALQAQTDVVTLTRKLPSGSTVILAADTGIIDQSRTTLRIAMILTGLAGLAGTALVLPLTLRRAIRPMAAMANLARAIAGGERGHRLRPERTDTELGRTAAAFDSMLDSLEHAERRAHDSDTRSRRFLADVAHELRTPMAGVQATAEAVLHAPDNQPRDERDRMHLVLAREARRAGRLLDDLLLLARVDAGLELHREPVNLHDLCTTEAERLRLRAPHLEITVTGADDSTVPGDAHRLAQILANLLDNAYRHGAPDPAALDPGATITVTITVTITGHPEHATVDVADNGPGVAPSQREMIFHRFVRHHTDGGRPGAGLGLAIARGIANAHGGDLRCEQTPPGAQGAVFRLILPRHSPTTTPLSGA